jgi:hypothetical protein
VEGPEDGQRTRSCAKRPFPAQKRPDETIFTPHVVILKQTGNVVAASQLGGRVMSTIENDSAGSESWDPAIWSIGTVLGVAIVYLACLT